MLSALRGLPSFECKPNARLVAKLPGPGELRVRKIVHRGAPRPVTKVPSIKLQRIVQCESVLEAELALILDACPGVSWFAEQPVVLGYLLQGERKHHVPDFAVQAGETQELVEVKFDRDVNDAVLARTAMLVDLLAPYGIGYRLVSEGSIRAGSALGNARKLLLRGREVPSRVWSLQVYETVRASGTVPLGEFGWDRPQSCDAAGVARQILDGCLHLDMRNDITAKTPVSVSPSSTRENLLWQPAPSR